MTSEISGNLLPWLREEWEKLKPPEPTAHEGVDKGSRPKMQKVPRYMAKMEDLKKYYRPQVISIGPIHYGKDELAQGKSYKYQWTGMYLRKTDQTPEGLYQRISNDLRQLSDQFPEKYPSDDHLEWNLTLDGCSILQVLESYPPNSELEAELNISTDKLAWVHQDLILLENQIPFKVLKLICGKDDARLKRCLQNFLEIHVYKMVGNPSRDKKKRLGTANAQAADQPEVSIQIDGEEEPVHLLDFLRRKLLKRDRNPTEKDAKPVHLLDFLRRKLLKRDRNPTEKDANAKLTSTKSMHLRKYRSGTIRELKAAGIRMIKDPNLTFYPLFNDGKLRLPKLTVDGSTAFIFLNLIAYEMCPDFMNDLEISSYVVFLSSLIEDPEDVKELRTAGILKNELASDQDVADLFNEMDIVLVPETPRFATITKQIQLYFESRPRMIKMLAWMEEAYNTYFRSPWTIIALLAGTFALVLAFIQTWFTVNN